MTRTIEDIVLDHDRRGIGALRPHVPDDFCTQAARYLLDHPGPVIITTGFYILMSDAPETDGPPGAFAIANAIRSLGHPVIHLTDRAHGRHDGVVAGSVRGPVAGNRFSGFLRTGCER